MEHFLEKGNILKPNKLYRIAVRHAPITIQYNTIYNIAEQ